VRVTNNMRQTQVLRDLQAGLSNLAEAQQQVASGKRFTRPSEDPVAASRVMRADRSLRGITQYRRNSTAVRVRVDSEEATLNQLTDLLSRAKELGVSQGSDTANADSRNETAAELDRIIEQVISLGNTKVGNEYLFGGGQTAVPPFQPDGTYLGDDGVRQAEIAQGYVIDTNHTGRQLLQTSGVISSLTAIRDALRAGTGAGVTATIGGIDSAFDQVQVLLAETGARSRQLDTVAENLTASESTLQAAQSADQGITVEEAATRMVSVQTALQAALTSTSRVISMSLVDYLR
jgi:flagellar hook-associated protein 3 FlgL